MNIQSNHSCPLCIARSFPLIFLSHPFEHPFSGSHSPRLLWQFNFHRIKATHHSPIYRHHFQLFVHEQPIRNVQTLNGKRTKKKRFNALLLPSHIAHRNIAISSLCVRHRTVGQCYHHHPSRQPHEWNSQMKSKQE